MIQSDTMVIVPAYNEATCISDVIDRVKKAVPEAYVVVVNDGSIDETGKIAEGKGVFVMNLPYNLGVGAAVQTGYQLAFDMGCEVAIQVDGDGQHPPEYLPQMIEMLKEKKVDMVIGSRYLSCDYLESCAFRSFGKKILSKVITFLCRQKVSDSTSGYRVANKELIQYFAKMYPHDYPEPETVALLIKDKYRVLEFPVDMKERINGASSITFIKGIYYVSKVLLAISLRMITKRNVIKEK